MISIIIPVYNCDKYLSRCLESIARQSYKDYEVFLIDDGSFDNSGFICDQFSKLDNRFKVIHVSNGGVSRARNIGLNLVKGDFVTFIDADDWVESNLLEIYSSALQDGSIDAVRVGYYRDYELNNAIYQVEEISSYSDELFNDCADLFRFTERCEYYSFVWNTCVRRSIIGTQRFQENINWLEDHCFCYELWLKCQKVRVLPNMPYHYIKRKNVSSLSTQRTPETLVKAITLEFNLKLRLNHKKYIDIDYEIEQNYRFHIHSLVKLLYSKPYSYKQRKSFHTVFENVSNLQYKQEKIFFSHIPFMIKDSILKIYYLISNSEK